MQAPRRSTLDHRSRRRACRPARGRRQERRSGRFLVPCPYRFLTPFRILLKQEYFGTARSDPARRDATFSSPLCPFFSAQGRAADDAGSSGETEPGTGTTMTLIDAKRLPESVNRPGDANVEGTLRKPPETRHTVSAATWLFLARLT